MQKKDLLKIFKLFTLIAFSIFLLLVLSLFALNSPWARKPIKSYLENTLSVSDTYKVKIKKIEEIHPSTITLSGVTVSDTVGVYAEIEALTVTIVPWKLFYGSIQIPSLRASPITIHRTPEQTFAKKSTNTLSSYSLFWRPRRLAINHLDVSSLKILTEEKPDLLLEMSGNMRLTLRRQIKGQINLNISEPNPETVAKLKSVFRLKNNEATSEFHLRANSKSKTLQKYFPDVAFSVDSQLFLSGPTQSWVQFVNPNISSASALTGKLTVNGKSDQDTPLFRALGQRLNSSVQIQAHPQQGIHLSNFFLNTPLISSSGKAFLSKKKILDTQLQWEISDWTPLELELGKIVGGDLDGQLSLNWSPTSFDIENTVEGSNLRFDRLSIREAEMHFLGNIIENQLVGNSDLSLSVGPEELKGKVNIVASNEQLSLKKLKLKGNSASITGNLDFSSTYKLPIGNLDAKLLNLTPWSDFLSYPLQGSGEISTSIDKHQKTKINAHMRNLTLGLIRMQQGSLVGHVGVQEIGITPNLKLSCRGIKYLDHQIQIMNLDIGALDSSTWPFAFDSRGIFHNAFDLKLSGIYQETDLGHLWEFEQLSGQVLNQNISMKNKSSLEYSAEHLTAKSWDLSIGAGRLLAELSYLPDTVTCNLSAKKIPIFPLHQIYDLAPETGLLNCEIFIDGTPKDPVGTINGDLNNIHFSQPHLRSLPPINATWLGDLNRTLFSFQSTVAGLSNIAPITLHGTQELTLPLQWNQLPIDSNSNMDISTSAQGPLLPFLQLLLPDNKEIGGNLDGSLHLGGTWSNPYLDGSCQISDAWYQNDYLGFSFRDLKGELIAKGSEIRLTNLHGYDKTDGVIQGTGNLQAFSSQSFPFHIDLDLSRVAVVDRPAAKAVANGQVRLFGNFQETNLEGELDVLSGIINIPKNLPSRVPQVDVTFINTPQDTSPSQESKRMQMNFDLKVNANETVSVKGRGITSTWKGDLKLGGNRDKLLLYGDLKLTSGEYRFNNRRFRLQKGRLQFNGDPANDAALNIEGILSLSELTVFVMLDGPLSSPHITFRSQPDHSINEILSWIMFNKEGSELSTFQAIQLAQAAVSLSSTDSNANVQSKILQQIGLDRLTLKNTPSLEGEDGDNEVSIEAGKYLSEGVFVSVTRSVDGKANQVGIEADFTQDIKIEAEIGDNAEAKIITKWKHDY